MSTSSPEHRTVVPFVDIGLESLFSTLFRERVHRIITDLEYISRLVREMPELRKKYAEELSELEFLGIEL